MTHMLSSPGCVDLLVDRHVRSGRSDALALIERSGRHRRSLTYHQLQHATIVAAHELNIRLGGRRKPQRIAIIGSATLETTVYWLAAMRAQHLVLLVHPDLPVNQYEMLWQDFDPDLILGDQTFDKIPVEGLTIAQDLLETECEKRPSHPVGAMEARFDLQPALALATSGSTGRAKLCVHPHRSFWEFERTVTRRMWQIGPEDRVLATTGPFFSFGLQGIHVPLSVGATAVLLPRWKDHTDFLEVMEEESVSVFLAVPTLYHLLLSKAEREYRLESLRLSMSAGERLPAGIRKRWQDWTGSLVLDSIGTTETFSPYLSETPDSGAGLLPVEGFVYHEADPLGQAEVGEAETIMLGLSGGCMMLGYLKPGEGGTIDPVASVFWTNDLFIRRGQAHFYVSRDSDRIKVAGYWVSPQELEEFLLQDPRVLKAAALPIQTDAGLCRLRAYVVSSCSGYAGEALVRELMVRAQRQLWPKALRPDHIELVADIATTPSGKLKRQDLRSLVTSPSSTAGAVLLR